MNHPNGISINYEPVIHALCIRQSAKVLSLRNLDGGLATDGAMTLSRGDVAICRFRFLFRPEYLKIGTLIVLREGRTTGVGTVIELSAI